MDGGKAPALLTAWAAQPERSLMHTLVCSCCSAGITLLVTGGVMAAVFRPALGGAAVIALGTALLGCGLALSAALFCSRIRKPKLSSAAKADASPADPLCLLPVYPSGGCQVLVLPGGVEPVFVAYPGAPIP